MTKYTYAQHKVERITAADYVIAAAIACLGFMAFWGIAIMLMTAGN